MMAFASGLGGKGDDIFAQTLLKDPILKDNPSAISQVRQPPGWQFIAIYNSSSIYSALFWDPQVLHTCSTQTDAARYI